MGVKFTLKYFRDARSLQNSKSAAISSGLRP